MKNKKRFINIKRLLILNIFLVFSCNLFFNISFSKEITTEEIADSLDIDILLNELSKFNQENGIEDINPNSLFNDLIEGDGINYSNLTQKVLNAAFGQIKTTLKASSILFFLIIMLAIISNIELTKDSDVIKITTLVVFILLTSVLLKNYIEIIQSFKTMINVLNIAMQSSSTFLIGIIVATGKINSVGIIKPLVIFISNAISLLVEYIVLPLFTVSIVINVVSHISENIRLDNLSSMFRKITLGIFTGILGLFILLLSLETTISKSIDSIYLKTAQNMVSNYVPVVGKFLSDSMDTVLGATSLIGKTGGVVSIVCVTALIFIPIFKMLSVVVLYSILVGISEPLNVEKDTLNYIKSFIEIYKDLLGILIGILMLFIMSTGIMMSLIGG